MTVAIVASVSMFVFGLAVGFRWGKEALGREIHRVAKEALESDESLHYKVGVLRGMMWFCERYL